MEPGRAAEGWAQTLIIINETAPAFNSGSRHHSQCPGSRRPPALPSLSWTPQAPGWESARAPQWPTASLYAALRWSQQTLLVLWGPFPLHPSEPCRANPTIRLQVKRGSQAWPVRITVIGCGGAC